MPSSLAGEIIRRFHHAAPRFASLIFGGIPPLFGFVPDFAASSQVSNKFNGYLGNEVRQS
jgi:hypothetical protein